MYGVKVPAIDEHTIKNSLSDKKNRTRDIRKPNIIQTVTLKYD